MPLTYSIDPDEKLITITGEYADASEWREVLSRILNDARRRPGFAFLRDLRGASNPVDANTVVGIISVVRKFWPSLQPSRAAVLTPRAFDPAALVAHALADAQHMPLQTFTSYDAARDWLREGVMEYEKERRIRDAALDETIQSSFPASDPPSTTPNPCDHDALEPPERTRD